MEADARLNYQTMLDNAVSLAALEGALSIRNLMCDSKYEIVSHRIW